MKKHYETHVEDTDKLISVAGPILEYKSWYEQYRKLMEEQAQRKYGLYTPTSEGDDDDFPSITGMIARYSALGLTNEQMKENPVWVDKTGNGNDLQLKNFAWKGMSGVGGYVQNFNDFRNNATVDKIRIDEQNSNSVKVTILTTGIGNAIYIAKDIYQFNKSYFIKISSEGYNEGDLSLSFYATSTSTATTVKVPLNPNGITEIPAIKEDDFLAVYLNVGGKVGSITIEQLPIYPGALVFDGVDDSGVCDNFPVLTKEKGYTVVALRQWITRGEIVQGLVSNVKDWFSNGAFILEYGEVQPVSFGAVGDVVDLPRVLTYQTSKSCNGVPIRTGKYEGTDVLHVGKLASTNVGTCINAAIWELVFLDHDATEEELQKIQDYYKKEYPWLFPDQAWTVTGKTNEDEDRATIANITGNGNDLILSNFGFSENSGYGLYFFSSLHSDLDTNANYTHIGYNQITLHNVKTEISSVYTFIKSVSAGQKIDFTIKISGLTALNEANPGFKIKNSQSRAEIALDASSDGIYHIQGTIQESDYTYVTCTLTYDNGNIPTDLDLNVTIEQIPEYEGYLVTDGVDDRVVSRSFTLNKDWTIVGNWKMLQPEANKSSGIVKQNSLFIYNHVDGLNISINDAWNFFKLKDIRSVNAICSDGRIYLNDWTEIIDSKQQTVNESVGTLVIGILGNVYTSLAFKNLGIYNNQILSKDDCIKAYNYLQTLKSK